MLTIKKLRADHVIDFAAEELKKYLRMMMPEGGDVPISYDPDAQDGFRLGLLEDFGLPSEAEDPILDDVIHVDTTPQGGVLAGSNPRSVLFAVYRLLRENGCRWLYPGVDGEFIPTVDVLMPVTYHKAAEIRFRGFCDEGSESQTCMLECADFYPKLELNTFAVEWFIPNGYYNRYYTHLHNTANRIPEEVDDRQILQWRRQLETEINKRGLILPAIGHGWTCRPFGFPATNTVDNVFELPEYTEEQMSVVALRGGKREFFRARPIYTNLCMSDPNVRRAFVQEVADYAQSHQNLTYLRLSLADGNCNHCECDECQKMRPSDWYLTILNEVDEELTRRDLPTRLTFSAYLDTFFAPRQVKIKNPKRFFMSYAPISRDYQSSITEDTVTPPAQEYVRNAWTRPTTTEECYAFLKEWQQVWPGDIFTFEYHFWRHQFLDPGGLAIARRLYEDVRSLKPMGLRGFVEDGSQRSGFPNGFLVYLYAAALMDRDVDFDAVKEDYFSHAYGPDWKQAARLLQQISDAFDFGYMEGTKSENKDVSDYYAPAHAASLARAHELAAQERTLAAKHLNMPTRPQTVSWRLLLRHAEYCDLLADILTEKALGHNYRAQELAQQFCGTFGRHELEIERYYDHSLACRVLEHITRKPQGNIILD